MHVIQSRTDLYNLRLVFQQYDSITRRSGTFTIDKSFSVSWENTFSWLTFTRSKLISEILLRVVKGWVLTVVFIEDSLIHDPWFLPQLQCHKLLWTHCQRSAAIFYSSYSLKLTNQHRIQFCRCLWPALPGQRKPSGTISAVQTDFCQIAFQLPPPSQANGWIQAISSPKFGQFFKTAVLTMEMDILIMTIVKHYSLMAFRWILLYPKPFNEGWKHQNDLCSQLVLGRKPDVGGQYLSILCAPYLIDQGKQLKAVLAKWGHNQPSKLQKKVTS